MSFKKTHRLLNFIITAILLLVTQRLAAAFVPGYKYSLIFKIYPSGTGRNLYVEIRRNIVLYQVNSSCFTDILQIQG